MLFRLQKYKKFESNSQRGSHLWKNSFRCFDCKSTKNLRAIHNGMGRRKGHDKLFRLQKYKKFESNSQPCVSGLVLSNSCFDCKSTKNLRAIHNGYSEKMFVFALFRLQKYKKFESNSQLYFQQYQRQNVVSTAKVQKI